MTAKPIGLVIFLRYTARLFNYLVVLKRLFYLQAIFCFLAYSQLSNNKISQTYHYK